MAHWELDPAHSHVTFTVRHMMFAKVRGSFRTWRAELGLSDDLTASTVRVEVDVASIDTGEEKRDAHLRSPDFFDAEKHPKLTFVSKRVDKTKDGLKLIGDLAMHGETHEIALDVEEAGRGKDPWGQERIAFSGKTTVDRTKWGLKWNQALETGGVLVSEKVEIAVDVEAVKKA
jgi:polyisoprenoid-binding protein YceI